MRPWWRWENDEKNVHIWWPIAFMELSVTTLGQHSWGVASIFFRRNKNRQNKHKSCGQSNYNDQINNLVLGGIWVHNDIYIRLLISDFTVWDNIDKMLRYSVRQWLPEAFLNNNLRSMRLKGIVHPLSSVPYLVLFVSNLCDWLSSLNVKMKFKQHWTPLLGCMKIKTWIFFLFFN